MTRIPSIQPVEHTSKHQHAPLLIRSLPLGAQESREQAHILKALADPVRLRIVNLLHRDEGVINVQTIGAHFSLEQPTISYHVRLLREANLVQSQKAGCEAYYLLCRETFASLRSLIDTLLERDENNSHQTDREQQRR